MDVPSSAWDWVDRGTAIAFVPVVLVAAWALWVLWRAVPDLWQTRTVTGDVVRGRRFRQWFSSGDEPAVLVLPGPSTTGRRIGSAPGGVRDELWAQRSQGETVRAVVTPRLGYVRSMEPA